MRAKFPLFFYLGFFLSLNIVFNVYGYSDYPASDYPTCATFTINNNSTHFWALAQNGSQLWLSVNATYVLQNAFDNLPEIGGKVYLKSGIYPIDGIYITNKVSASDYPNQHIIFEGEGKYVSTLFLKDNANGVTSKLVDLPSYKKWAMVFVESYSNDTTIRITIKNIGFHGNRINQTKNISGLIIRNDEECFVEDNYFYMCGGHGIVHLNTIVFREAYFGRNTIYQTDFYGANPSDPDPNIPLEEQLSSMWIFRHDVVIYDNFIGWCGYRNETSFKGIGIAVSLATPSVQRNWVWGCKYGFLLTNAKFYLLINNFCDGNKEVAIYLWNSHCGIVQNNEARVGFRDSYAIILIGGNSSYNSIKINRLWVWCPQYEIQSTQYGILEQDSSDYNIIADNDIMVNATTLYSNEYIDKVGEILKEPIKTVGVHTKVYNNNLQTITATNQESPPSEIWFYNPRTLIITIGLLCAIIIFLRKII